MGGQSFEKPVDPDAYYAFRNNKPGEAVGSPERHTKMQLLNLADRVHIVLASVLLCLSLALPPVLAQRD